MRLLLDTHAYFWWETDDPKLSVPARDAIAAFESEVLISAVTAWELAFKGRFGKWPGAGELASDINAAMEAEKFLPLPISIDHARLAGAMPGAHRDPFDRLLAAQAKIENIPLVTADPAFRSLGIKIIW